jgi:hypothetical protein
MEEQLVAIVPEAKQAEKEQGRAEEEPALHQEKAENPRTERPTPVGEDPNPPTGGDQDRAPQDGVQARRIAATRRRIPSLQVPIRHIRASSVRRHDDPVGLRERLILDDGSHKTHHQIISFGALFRPALKDGGRYMVEDVHTNYWIKHVDSPETFIDLSKQMIDMLHEPYFGRKETDFRHEHPDALQELDLGYLSANLDGISFHDSIVVFDKKKQSLPKSELR